MKLPELWQASFDGKEVTFTPLPGLPGSETTMSDLYRVNLADVFIESLVKDGTLVPVEDAKCLRLVEIVHMETTPTTTYTLYWKTGRSTTHLEQFATHREASYRKDEVDEDPAVWHSKIINPHKTAS